MKVVIEVKKRDSDHMTFVSLEEEGTRSDDCGTTSRCEGGQRLKCEGGRRSGH